MTGIEINSKEGISFVSNTEIKNQTKKEKKDKNQLLNINY